MSAVFLLTTNLSFMPAQTDASHQAERRELEAACQRVMLPDILPADS